MNKTIFIALAMLAWLGADAQQAVDLSGAWQLSLDSVNTVYNQQVVLPGTLDEAGIGTPNTLQPALQKPQLSRLTRRHAHIGRAWYLRVVDIPPAMAGQPLELVLERVMWQSRLLVDGTDMGQQQESLVAPHVFSLPAGLAAGRHVLTLCIDNSKQHDISVDNLAHSYTNDTQIMWNGVLGQMELRTVPAVREVQVYPDVKHRRLGIRVTGTATDYRFALNGHAVAPVKSAAGLYTLDMADMKEWNEFTPYLYMLTVEADGSQQTVSFGMREMATDGNRLLVNGRPTFLRGTLECCIFPLTGTPPMDERGWAKVFTTAREYGLNHLRFHSWCPPEAAFRMADRMGFYLQVELPNWSLTVNGDTATARFLRDEFGQIVRYYGNHPSLCIISYGNELQPDFGFLNALTRHMKQTDPRHLYTTTTFTFEKGHGVSPEPEDEVFITQWTDKGWVRGQGVFDERMPDFKTDYRAAAEGIGVPLISHEIGQYSVYPNVHEADKYTGVLEPLNFQAIRNDLKSKGLLGRANDYVQASGRLAALLYKEEIERALKTPQQSGFQLLDLHDFPGQGTALVGLLDAFWDSKGLIEPSRFREFCAPVVPLARFDKAVFRSDETLTATIEIADYSAEPAQNATISWLLADANDNVYASGTGREVSIYLNKVREAQRMELRVVLDGTPWRNRWSVWVYPVGAADYERVEQSARLVVTGDADEALRALKKGRKVLFSPNPSVVKGLEGKFLPVFWSPVHFPKQAGTMGLLCHTAHPALSHFPTDINSDWQWWRLVKQSKVMVVDSIPEVTPIVESVDNFVNNRRLAQVFEARVGKGSLLMSSFNLLGDDLPEVRQLRYSLTTYMASEAFAPKHAISESDVRSLLLQEAEEVRTGATSIYE